VKRLIPFVLLLIPAALFAQGPGAPASPRARETRMLKGFGLTDAQVTQVFDIQDKARTAVRQDTVQLRLLHAQMEKALLPAAPNMPDVNALISQMAQTRADIMKTLVGARVQLRQIIGEQNFPAYSRYIRQGLMKNRRLLQMRRSGPGGGNGSDGRMRNGAGPRGGAAGPDGWM
jgi:Spy/CpxP family protein refolding chaperone